MGKKRSASLGLTCKFVAWKKKVDGRCGKQRFTGKQYVVLDNGIYKT